MTKKIIKLLTISIILLISGNAMSQDFKKGTCGTDKAMEILYKKNPRAKTELQQLRKQEKSTFSKNAKRTGSYVVPVVFHVFGTEFNNGSTVDLNIIKEALRLTNEDFQGLNADYSTIDAPFDAIKAPLDITFKLAQLDPDGNPTSGVVFHSEASGMGNYGSTVVKNVAWDNYKYCNVYIARDLYGDGDHYNSGVAWYPSKDMSDQNIARVVYNGSYLGTNTGENFRSVLTHEFGHYLNLAHTFNKGICNNDPNDGDGVADTPSLKKSSSGTKCAILKNCLNQEINSENFMDYTDCYKMFTQGQVARMTNALDNSVSRNTLWTEANLIATGISTDLGARIVASSTNLEERYLNDGIIEQSSTLNCIDCTFTKNSGNLILGTDYTISNLPTGITSKITLESNTKAVISLEGKANNNEAVNSVSNLVVTFLNPMITGGVSTLYNDKINFIINFKDTYTKFCNVNIGYKTYTHITNVDFNGTSNQTGYEGISNYIPTLKFKTKQGQTYPLTITTNKGAGGINDETRIQIWIDWNKDFIYDSSELFTTDSYKNTEVNAEGNYTFTTNVTIPLSAELGDIAFRVLAHYVQGTDGDTPCSYIDSGESEDYGISILSKDTPFTVDFFSDTTDVNFSQAVNFSDSSIPSNGDTITAWNWSFEGGVPNTSTERNPKNVLFPEAGNFDITLEVTTANGSKKTITKTEHITSKLSYCESNPKFGGYFNVNNITLNTINHQPYKSNSFSFYETVATELVIGQTYPITIKTEKGDGGTSDINRVRVWADWNFDSQFSADELLVSKEVSIANYNASGEYEFTKNITVPANAAIGKKVAIRVIGHYVQNDEGETACGSYDSGNTADYGLIIKKGSNEDTPFTVDFFGNETDVILYEEVNFFDSSIPEKGDTITAWNWSFEGGVPSTSTEKNPKGILFSEAGNFDITLEVTTANGSKKTITKTEYITSKLFYCDSSPEFGGYFNVNNINLNTIINHQPSKSSSFSYYETVATELKVGQTYPITIKTEKGNGGNSDVNRVRVWADWNFDSQFSADELLVSKEVKNTDYNGSGEYEFTENITVPANAAIGKKVALRVIGHYVQNDEGEIACGSYDSGNTADYGLIIKSGAVNWSGASDTNWNNTNNWVGNILPTNTSDVIIPANATQFPTINTPTTVKSVIIESGASLITNAKLTATVTYKRNLATDNWYLVSSPLSNETVNNMLANNIFALGTNNNLGFSTYNNNGTAWNYLTNTSTGNISKGKGYAVKLNTTADIKFTGTTNFENVTIPITSNTNSYNLIGNPYTSYINLGEFFTANPKNTVVSETTVWLWNQATKSYDLKLAGIDGNFQITPGQGFFISANANTNVTFDKNNQSHIAGTFQKQENTKMQVNITATNNGKAKTTKLYYLNGATTGFDNGFDGSVFKGVKTNFNVFTKLVNKENSTDYAVQSLPINDLSKTIIPIGLKANANETIVFSAKSFNLPADAQVYIEDKENDKFINLSEENYSVTLSKNTNNTGQFFIHTTKKNNTPILKDIAIFQSSKNSVTITGLQSENNTIQIYSAIGKQIMTKNFKSNGTTIITLPKIASGIYVVNVTSDAKKVNKKIIFNN